jgi:hypothetical protein
LQAVDGIIVSYAWTCSCAIFSPKPNGDRRLCGRGDVNGDFKVDFTDVLVVLAVFSLPAGGGLEDRDVNQDGRNLPLSSRLAPFSCNSKA